MKKITNLAYTKKKGLLTKSLTLHFSNIYEYYRRITNFAIHYGLEANSCDNFYHMIQPINELRFLLRKHN